jgi:hypothetical protein
MNLYYGQATNGLPVMKSYWINLNSEGTLSKAIPVTGREGP